MLVILLAGCSATTNGNLQDVKDPWTGATYDEVVARWGTPVRYTVLSDGGYLYTWESESAVPRASIYPSIGFFGGSGGFSVGTGVTVGSGGAVLVRCDRTLVFRQAVVAEQTWQGDPDYCGNFKR